MGQVFIFTHVRVWNIVRARMLHRGFLFQAQWPGVEEEQNIVATSGVNIIPSEFPYPECQGLGCYGELLWHSCNSAHMFLNQLNLCLLNLNKIYLCDLVLNHLYFIGFENWIAAKTYNKRSCKKFEYHIHPLVKECYLKLGSVLYVSYFIPPIIEVDLKKSRQIKYRNFTGEQ